MESYGKKILFVEKTILLETSNSWNRLWSFSVDKYRAPAVLKPTWASPKAWHFSFQSIDSRSKIGSKFSQVFVFETCTHAKTTSRGKFLRRKKVPESKWSAKCSLKSFLSIFLRHPAQRIRFFTKQISFSIKKVLRLHNLCKKF